MSIEFAFINSLLNAGHCEVSNVLLTHYYRSDMWWNNVVMRTFTGCKILECAKRRFSISATAYHQSWREATRSCGDHCLCKGE